jgi:hypothetical protein
MHPAVLQTTKMKTRKKDATGNRGNGDGNPAAPPVKAE